VQEQKASRPVIEYLHTHFLPGYPGLFAVTVNPSGRLSSCADWQEGALLLKVSDGTAGVANPVGTARLAAAWQQYS
jgi:hypothetical protein